MNLDELKTIYADYEEAFAEAAAKAPALAGAFGFGSADDPRNAPCHGEFDKAVGQWTAALAATDDHVLAEQAAEYILTYPAGIRGTGTCWFASAASRHITPLVPLLSPQAARKLAETLDSVYPRQERFPALESLRASLRQKAGLPASRGIFGFLRRG